MSALSIPARRRIRRLANRRPSALEHGLELGGGEHPGRVQLAREINLPLSDLRALADVERGAAMQSPRGSINARLEAAQGYLGLGMAKCWLTRAIIRLREHRLSWRSKPLGVEHALLS